MVRVRLSLLIGLVAILPFFVSAKTQPQEIFIETELIPANPRVQQQVIYTIRLYRESHLQRGHFLTPEIPQAVVKLKQSLPARDVKYKNHDYELLEQQYYLYPQSSGELLLPAPVFSSQELYIKGKNAVLNVLPAKNSHTQQPWLVVEELRIAEQWDNQNATLQIGSIFERKITLRAKNTLSLFLPEVPLPKMQGIELQRLPAEVSELHQNGALVAQRIEHIRYIAEKAGHYQLPEINISWWDSQEEKFQTSRLAKRSLLVNAGPYKSSSVASPIGSEITKNNLKSKPNVQFELLNLLEWLLWILILVVLLLLGIFYQLPHKIKKYLQLLRLKKQLTQACKKNNATLTRDILLQWARLCFAETAPQQLLALAKLSPELEIQHSLQSLDQAIYGKNVQDWQGEQALIWLRKLIETHGREKILKNNSALLKFWQID